MEQAEITIQMVIQVSKPKGLKRSRRQHYEASKGKTRMTRSRQEVNGIARTRRHNIKISQQVVYNSLTPSITFPVLPTFNDSSRLRHYHLTPLSQRPFFLFPSDVLDTLLPSDNLPELVGRPTSWSAFSISSQKESTVSVSTRQTMVEALSS